MIVSARLHGPLRSTVDILGRQIAHFSAAANNGTALNCEDFANALKGATPWTDQDLSKLTLLPSDAAAHLAAARSIIDMTVTWINLMKNVDQRSDEGKKFLTGLIAALEDARSKAIIGLTECERYMRLPR